MPEEATEKTIKMYLASDTVKVYPSAYRSANYDPEARLQTEYNLTHAVGQHGGQNSFVIDFGSKPDGTAQEAWANPLKCVIGGYYFEISRSATSAFGFYGSDEKPLDAEIDSIYLGIALRGATISVSSANLYSQENNQGNDHVIATTTQRGTKVLENLAKRSASGEDASDDILDQMFGPYGDEEKSEASYFYGLAVIKCASAPKVTALSDYSAFVKIFTRGKNNELVPAYDSKITNAISAGEAASSVILNVDKGGRETDRMNEINIASGDYSTAMGVGTIAKHEGQLAFGKYNQEPTDPTSLVETPSELLVETVGGGTKEARKTVRQLNSAGLEKLTSGLVVQGDVTNDDSRQISIKLGNGSKTNKAALTERTLVISNDSSKGQTDAYKTRVSASVGNDDMTTTDNPSTWASIGVYGGATAVEINAPANGLGNASIALSDKANANEGTTGLTKKANIGLTKDALEIATFYDWDKGQSKYAYTENNEGKIKLRAGESIELAADGTKPLGDAPINRHISLIADGEKAKFELTKAGSVYSAKLSVTSKEGEKDEGGQVTVPDQVATLGLGDAADDGTQATLKAPVAARVIARDGDSAKLSAITVGGRSADDQKIALIARTDIHTESQVKIDPASITESALNSYSLKAGQTISIALTDSLLLNMTGEGEGKSASASLTLSEGEGKRNVSILSISVPTGALSDANQITVKIGATGVNSGEATNALDTVNVILPTLTDQEINDIFK